MARKNKNVYERISEKLQDIKTLEEQLEIANQDLANLRLEQDDLEKNLLLQFIRENNISFEEAKAMMKVS